MDFIEVQGSCKELLDFFLQIPPNFKAAKDIITRENFSSDEISKVAICYAEKCGLEVGDHLFEIGCEDLSASKLKKGVVPGLHSTYLYSVVDFLLAYRLNPNYVFGSNNLLHSLFYVDNEYVGADTMRLLFDNGADPNLKVEGESIYDMVEEDIWFGSIEQYIRWRYDGWVHMMFVILAYGGKNSTRSQNITRFKEYDKDELFSLDKLKDHRNYYYGLCRGDNETILRVFEKDTFWEVACW